jgi:alkanesulfonate monooxygenase SsuD/methylene tetrahydromethanopterin reductase-like flavin-dependent oxidoreductase (luciferase family)
MQDGEANRELFEEQVDIIFKAFNEESFSHQGKHYHLPPPVPYRGYVCKDITLVPRPVNRPVECWQPIVSANPRGLDFMVRHGIKGAVGGGAATMAEGPIHAYRAAAARAGKDLKLGENLTVGIFFHLAETPQKAARELKPLFEEHVKMFAPLGFVPGITPAQTAAAARRGGWAEAGVPTLEHFMRTGAWFAGTAAQLIVHLKALEARYPGMEHINLSTSMGTPQAIMLEQLQRVAEEVMPAFR